MEKTPKSLRVQIGIFGRTNVGKSSLLNMLANQDVAITSPIPGTTTDVVEKQMELLPLGPVNFLDTPGINDTSELGEKRLERTQRILDRAEIIILVVEPNIWTDFEEDLTNDIKKLNIPFIIAVTKTDIYNPTKSFLDGLEKKSQYIIQCSTTDLDKRDYFITQIKNALLSINADLSGVSLPLLGDLIKPGSLVVLIVPIDSQAPKGRLILPQVHAIRDILDNGSISIVVRDTEYSQSLESLTKKPDLVICDSQVVHKMVAETPADVKCTTFSILFSRYKGDLVEEVKGATKINNLKQGDKILIAEACSHHPLEDDIGRIKLPNWLKRNLGFDLSIDVASGRDFPSNLNDYKLIIHCGSCMLTRHEKLMRIKHAKMANVPITNYGLAISYLQGVLDRTLSPFPDALEVFRKS